MVHSAVRTRASMHFFPVDRLLSEFSRRVGLDLCGLAPLREQKQNGQATEPEHTKNVPERQTLALWTDRFLAECEQMVLVVPFETQRHGESQRGLKRLCEPPRALSRQVFYYEVTKNTKDWLKICLFVVDICRGQHQLSAFSTLRIGVTGYSRGFSANQTV